jgi:hypothetical protein
VSNPSSRTKRRSPQKAQSRTAASASSGRRTSARVPEPVDYSKDYADVRSDLIRIGILSVILLGGMIGAAFFV